MLPPQTAHSTGPQRQPDVSSGPGCAIQASQAGSYLGFPPPPWTPGGPALPSRTLGISGAGALGTLVSTQAPGPYTDEDMAATVCPHRSAPPARGSIPRTCTSALYTLTCETLEIPPKALSPQHTGRKPRPSLQGPNEQAGRKPAGGTRAFLWSGSAGGLPAAGWGHWPLRGCRTRPGQALRAQPTQSRFVPAASAQPSLHLVQSPRQPAQGSPARPAGTPGRRAPAAQLSLARTLGFGPGS